MHLQLSFCLQCVYLVSDAEVRLKGKEEKKNKNTREKGRNQKGERQWGAGC